MRARSFLAAILSAGVLAAPARATPVAVSSGETYCQDFNGIGNSGTATLPDGWSVNRDTAARSVTVDLYTNALTKTTAQGAGAGTAHGIYNFCDGANTSDRGVGFLASNSGTGNGTIFLDLVADGAVPELKISYDMECYRNNTRQFRFQLFYSLDDGLTWTNAGPSFLTEYATASSAAPVNPAGSVSVSSQTLDVSLEDGDTIVLCWNYSVSEDDAFTYAQGLGIDNVVIAVPATVDPYRPVWTVGTPSPAPRVGTAFSFGVSAELEDGTPQTVAFGGLTPAATGAQPSFADGVFSWTPGEDAAGTYTAAFSVANDGGAYATNVAFTVRGSTEERELFWEDFPNYDNAWSSTVVISLPTTETRVSGWSGSNLYKGRSAIKLGKSNAADYGSATTPTVETVNGAAATVALTLDAAAYAGKTGTLGITAVDSATSAVLLSTNVVLAVMASNAVPSLAEYPIGPFRFAAEGQFKIAFAPVSGDGRMGIDSVKVTQTVSTSLVDLDVPTGLALDGGSLSTNSFSVLWTAVSNATAYTVALCDETGAEPFYTTNVAATTVSFAGLADDAAYRVRVRAEGDPSLFNHSDWSSFLSVRTARSPEHPTLSFGGWQNAVGDGGLYAGVANAAAVSAVRDDGTNAVVALESVSPAPAVGPALEDGVLFWTPVDADTNKTFTVSFLMDGTYATNLSFKVKGLAPLAPPTVAATNVLWNSFGLSWNAQYRAAGYAVRVWTDCPSPNATAARVAEDFPDFAAGVRPAGWTFQVKKSDAFYKDAKAPVKLAESTHFIETYDLGGPISSVSFHAAGHSIAGSASALTVVGIAADGTETVLATLTAADIGQTETGIDRTYSVPEGTDVRRIAWRYAKDAGGVGVGSVAIEGTGFSTPRWLPGWGPAAKDVGLVQGCTVAKPRPGKVLGVDPSDPRKDLAEPRVHYAEVAARDVAGAAFASVVEVDVPAPPRSVRATMMILR